MSKTRTPKGLERWELIYLHSYCAAGQDGLLYLYGFFLDAVFLDSCN